MSDPLHDKIIDGLNRLTDREKFEACAADLLRKLYPRLVPVPGGGDAGFDGAAQEENGDSIQMVCTTGEDVLGNLAGSLGEAKKKGRKSNAVLFVTSRRLTPATKQKLVEKATEFGKTLYPVYDQQPMANMLYRDSRWRKDLLGLSGNPPALSHLPANHRPSFEIPPLGRDKERARLVASTSDIVVFGQPGSGKTHLLAHLASENNGLFAVTADGAAIADGIRDQQPKWIIVDDSFTRLDELVALRQLRAGIGAEFRIVATCWPGQQDEVAAKLALTGQKPVELLPLPMKVIKELVTAMHIAGPDHLVHELLHQSAGKPGLTVTLCQICWQHGTKELFTGEALTRDIRLSLTTLAGDDAIRLLAHFALAGNAGLSIELVAEITGLSPIIVAKLTEKMGAAGVLEVRKERRLSVEPARLRQALVRDVFCRPPAPLDWRRLMPTLPDRADAVDALIAAGLLGGELNDDALRQEISGQRDSLQFGALCDHYARLGPAQSHWILTEFPVTLEKAAGSLLEHIPKEAIPFLLRGGRAEERFIRQKRDELSKLRAWIDEVGDKPRSVSRRVLLLEALEGMHDELQDTPTLLAGLRHVLSNHFERTDQPPGEAAMFRIQHGFVPPAALEQIAALWSRVLRMLSGLSTANALRLPELLDDWASPRPWGGGQLTAEYIDTCQRQARVMIADLARVYAENWVVLHRLQSIAERAGSELPAITGLPGILFPQRSIARDEELQREQHATVERLAAEWNARGPEPALVEDWLSVDGEAAAAGLNYPNLSRDLARLIAQQTVRPDDWLEALMLRKAPTGLVGPFTEKCVQSDGWAPGFVTRHLGDPLYGVIAVEHLLRSVPVADPAWLTAAPFIKEQAQLAGNLVLIDAVPEPTVLKLLTEFSPEVSAAVAANCWSAKPKGEIPEALQSGWRTAVVNCVEDVYQIEEIARAHPDLGCDWLKRRVNQKWDDRGAGGITYDSYHYLPGVIGALTAAHRREVINHFEERNYHGNVLAQLVGDDLDLLRHALSRPETAQLSIQCLGLPDIPPDHWVKRATLLLDAGRTEEEVFWASECHGGGGDGPWSRIYGDRLKHFQPLLSQPDPRVRRIGEEAVSFLSKCRDEALEHERVAAVKGHLA